VAIHRVVFQTQNQYNLELTAGSNGKKQPSPTAVKRLRRFCNEGFIATDILLPALEAAKLMIIYVW